MAGLEILTVKKTPWIQYDSGKRRYKLFGLCPECRKAVQLIGIEAPSERGVIPHGRHRLKKVDGFPHSLESMLTCSRFSGKARTDVESHLAKLTPQAVDLLRFIQENFHIMVEVFREQTGIVLSKRLAQQILHDFLCSKRYRWPTVTKRNVGVLFAYVWSNYSLYGQRIVAGSDLMQALKNVEGLEFSEIDQIKSAPGHYIEIEFGLRVHQVGCEDSEVEESIEFFVIDSKRYTGEPSTLDLVLSQRLEIDLQAVERKRRAYETGRELSNYSSFLQMMAKELVQNYLESGLSRRK